MTVELHANVDHVATLRQARGTPYPDPVHAATLCELAGADGITVHLREDRRHIQRRDVETLRHTVQGRLNLEMAATSEMVDIALAIRPDLVTLVPERREEQTTEGGLDVVGQQSLVRDAVHRLVRGGLPVSLFIDPSADQVRASADVGASAVELHTGDYANAFLAGGLEGEAQAELRRIADASHIAADIGALKQVAAGHGLTRRSVGPLIQVAPSIEELNIGHALVADAALVGMERAVREFIAALDRAASRQS